MDPRLLQALDQWDLRSPQRLAGDAGARRYFRVEHPSLGTAVVVIYPLGPGGKVPHAYNDFRTLQKYLDPVIVVPTILQEDADHGLLLLEDLGDTTLEQRLMEHPEEEISWARQIATMNKNFLGILTEGAPEGVFFMNRSFDVPKFDFEWNYCKKHFFQEFLQTEVPKWLDRILDDVHQSLSQRARFFTHRDSHVRNLMVRGDRLVCIDFQDARRGAATYDLASMVFDAYWDWSKEARGAMLQKAQDELGWSQQDLWEELTLSGIQRNFKALGTFGYQFLHRKKNRFAPSILRTLVHCKYHFERLNLGEGVTYMHRLARQAEGQLSKLGAFGGDDKTGSAK